MTDPSQADISLTNTLVAAMKLIGVRALDHIVVANNRSQRLADTGLYLALVQTNSKRFVCRKANIVYHAHTAQYRTTWGSLIDRNS